MNNGLFMKDNEYEKHKFKTPKIYEVDFDKVNSMLDLEILVEVLFKGLNIVVEEDSAYFQHLKNYLKEVGN